MAAAGVLARGIALITGGRVVGLAISLVQVKLSVSYLGPSGYGMLITVILFVGLFEAFTELGIGTVVVRRVSAGGADLEREIGLSMALSLGYGLPLVVICDVAGFLLYRHQPDVLFGIVLLSAGLAASTWSSCFLPVAQVKVKFVAYSAAELASRVLALVVTASAVYFDLGLRWVMIGQLMPPIARFVALQLWGGRQGRFRPVWHLREMLALSRETLPFAYILIISVVYYRFDGLMLTKLSTIAEVAAYGLAYRLAGQLTLIAPIVCNVLISRFAEDWAEDREKFAATVRMALRLMTLVCVPIAVLCWPYADHAIRLIGSGEFVESARHPLILLLVAVAFGMMSEVVSTALVVADQQNFLTRLNTATLVVNLALNAALIPAFGATGAGIALVGSETLGFLAAMWRTSAISESVVEWRSLTVTLALAGVAVAVGFALHDWPWPVSAAIVLAVYVLGQFATRNVPLATLRAIRTSA